MTGGPAVPSPLPPSFPTRRSRRVRDAVFAASFLAWAGVMFAVWRQPGGRALGEARSGVTVFSDKYEPHLTVRLTVEAPGVKIAGTVERATEWPFEGRAVVTEKWHASGDGVLVDAVMVSEWDAATGFRRAESTARVALGLILDTSLAVRIVRVGGFLDIEYEAPAGSPPKRARPVHIPEGVAISSGFLEAAPVAPLEVGTKWHAESYDVFSGELTIAEVEVVGSGTVEVDGRAVEGCRAVTRIDTPTGRARELTTWFEPGGRALRQEIPYAPISLVVERRWPGGGDNRGEASDR